VSLNDRTNPNRLAGRIGRVDRPPVQRYPSWMDPGYQLAACAGQWSEVQTIPASGEVVVPGNSRRWALGFAYPLMIVTSIALTPVPGPVTFPIAILGTAQAEWFTLDTLGPLVCYEWRAVGAPGGQFIYLELVAR